ncbi:MAG: hypothetical protein RLZZ361_1491 [Cyanobacteriota bacterium]|jgi:hypothetical protein
MQIKFRGGNMGIAPRPVLVDLTSDIPDPIRGADMFKSAIDKHKLNEQIKKTFKESTQNIKLKN